MIQAIKQDALDKRTDKKNILNIIHERKFEDEPISTTSGCSTKSSESSESGKINTEKFFEIDDEKNEKFENIFDLMLREHNIDIYK